MRDWNLRRIFRCLICLVLICALLVNFSPIRVKAFLVETYLGLTVAEWTVLALATLMSCGIFFHIQSQEEAYAIGDSFRLSFIEGTSAEQLELQRLFWAGASGSKIIPFRSSHSGDSFPDWLKLILFSLVGFVGRFCQENPDPIVYKDPVYTECVNGDQVLHNLVFQDGQTNCLKYEIFNASAPVICFNVCNTYTHYTVMVSSSSFGRTNLLNFAQSTAKKRTSNGVTFYYLYNSHSSSSATTYSADCAFTSETITNDYLDSLSANVIGNGIPEKALFPSLKDATVGELIGTICESEILSIPDIDFSSAPSLDELINVGNKVIAGELTFEDVLQDFTGGAAPEIVPLPDTGEGSDPTTSTEPDATEVPDPGVTPDPGGNPGVNPNPGTGTDPGTNPNPDPDPDPDPNPNPDPDPGTDPDSGSGSGSGSWKPPKIPMSVDLTQFFPFCIPFDLFEFFKLLHAEPVAPVLYWEMADLAGQTYSITIDLSEWDSVALLFRRLQLFLFICGLAAASRKFIKW